MSFFLKNWRQIELRATVLIVVENAPIFSLFFSLVVVAVARLALNAQAALNWPMMAKIEAERSGAQS
jgi:hypothetical protein